MADTDERSTPWELFNPLHEEFKFDVDVCAFSWNTKLPKYFSLHENGLKQDWAPMKCFMNPPYSAIKLWLNKAWNEANKGALVICILPMDSSTKWFHKFIWDKSIHSWRPGISIRFPDKRYSFGDYSNSAKFATLIAIFEQVK